MVKVVYQMRNNGDPRETECHGFRFRHGEEVDFDGRRKDHVAILNILKGNPYFSVDGEGAAPLPENEDPKTPESYRNYAIKWLGDTTSLSQLTKRWDAEAELREQIGWGSDDDELLAPFLQPRIDQLKQAE